VATATEMSIATTNPEKRCRGFIAGYYNSLLGL
jgi:hypothetical protein